MNMNQRGKFHISEGMVWEQPAMCMAILYDMIVVGCESNFIQKVLSYTAIGDMFEELKEGEDIPWYNIIVTVTKLEDGTTKSTFKFERVK